MQCFLHSTEAAVGICKSCGKGVCRTCAVKVDRGLACSDKSSRLRKVSSGGKPRPFAMYRRNASPSLFWRFSASVPGSTYRHNTRPDLCSLCTESDSTSF